MELQLPQPVTSDIGKPQLAEIMHEVSKEHPATIVVSHQGTWIAHLGKVTSSETKPPSARMAVWALQQPSKRYQALVSALALD
jgi:hypothetical protein